MKKSSILFFAILALALPFLSCRNPTSAEPQLINVIWEKTYGGAGDDYGRAIQQTSDGGYVIAGFTWPHFSRPKQSYILKTDSNGEIQWERKIAAQDDNQAYCINQTNDGGFIAVGIMGEYPSAPYFIRMNSAGDTLWTEKYEGHGINGSYSCIKVADENLIITGSIHDCMGLMKFNRHGEHIWNTIYLDGSRAVGTEVALTLDREYIIAGCEVTAPKNGVLIKADGNGDQIWAKRFSGPQGELVLSDVLPTPDGGFIAAGRVLSEEASDDAFLVKVNAYGDSVWAKSYGGHDFDDFRAVEMTHLGGCIAVGTTSSSGNGYCDIYVLLTDANGDSLASFTYGGDFFNYGFDIQRTDGGNYIILGCVYCNSQEALNIYLLKISAP